MSESNRASGTGNSVTPHRQAAAKRKDDGQTVTTEVAQYEGSLPHPEVLRGYNELVPNAAERFLDNFERDSEHLRRTEMTALIGDIVTGVIGQIFGLASAFGAFYVALELARAGHAAEAAAFGGTTIIGLVAVFVVGRIKKDPTDDAQE